VEGNPDHPETIGASNVLLQALPLGLYDPHRARELTSKGLPLAWRSLIGRIAERSETLARDGGRQAAIPGGAELVAAHRRSARAHPGALPQGEVRLVLAGGRRRRRGGRPARLRQGRSRPRHDLSRAEVILSFDADFLTDGPEQIRLHRQFSAGRVPGEHMNRLYVVEPCLTPTGTMADPPAARAGLEVVAVVQAIVSEAAKLEGMGRLTALAGLPRAQPQVRVDMKWAAAAAKDLHRARGRSLVLAGRRQPAAVHALVNALQRGASATRGATVAWRAPVRHDPSHGVAALQSLVARWRRGARGHAGDHRAQAPSTTRPRTSSSTSSCAGGGVALPLPLRGRDGALGHHLHPGGAHPRVVGRRARRGRHGLHHPAAHLAAVESHHRGPTSWRRSWGGRSRPARAPQGALAERAVTEGWSTPAGFDGVWESWLSKGIVDRTAAPPEEVSVDGGLATALGPLLGRATQGAGVEIAFAVDHKVFDGRFANNAWLQELPHPITKITWDNAILISSTTAQQVGVETGNLARVEIGDRYDHRVPVYVQPGHADEASPISLGYGRSGRRETGAGGLQRRARCARATRPGSRAARVVTRVSGPPPLRHHPGPLEDGGPRAGPRRARAARSSRRSPSSAASSRCAGSTRKAIQQPVTTASSPTSGACPSI
jgi:molybdopterin-containing oxidoreductase family iron-sulfur binding subunit